MKLEHCAETRTIAVAGVAYIEMQPIPISVRKTDHCILPVHAGGHIWDSEAHR